MDSYKTSKHLYNDYKNKDFSSRRENTMLVNEQEPSYQPEAPIKKVIQRGQTQFKNFKKKKKKSFSSKLGSHDFEFEKPIIIS